MAEEEGAELVDAEHVLAAAGGGEAPGARFFLDHVHLTLEGNWRVARALAATILGVEEARLPDLETTRNLLLHTPWSEQQQAKPKPQGPQKKARGGWDHN